MSEEYKNIQIHFQKLSSNLEVIMKNCKEIMEKSYKDDIEVKLKFKGETDTIYNILSESGFSDFSEFEEITTQLQTFAYWINRAESMNDKEIFIGDNDELNIIGNNKHYTIYHLRELKDLKDDFSKKEIEQIIEFYLNY